MNLQEAMGRYRTLVLEGRDGLDRDGPLAELAGGGFLIRRVAGSLHHLDPARPYRELLTGSERLALDGGMVRELVYGPLRRGRSRVTWIQALDFAEAVAERDGALLHLRRALGAPDPRAVPAVVIQGDAGREADEASAAYDRAFRTLAQHVPVVTIPAATTAPGGRMSGNTSERFPASR